jgi:hypothetical protein
VAVPGGVRRVEHDDVEVARQRAVLEAVVEDERVGAELLHGEARQVGAARPAQHARAGEPPREQEGLVAGLARAEEDARAVGDHARVAPARAVAAREQRDAPAAREEALGDGDRRGRLPRAAHGQVADRDHRRRGPRRSRDAGAVQRPPRRGPGAEERLGQRERRERHPRAGRLVAAPPHVLEPGHGGDPLT